jgi:hypothetical protein
LGVIAAAFLQNNSNHLSCGPYIALGGLLVLTTGVSQLIWLDFISAIKGGYVWVLMLVDFVAGFVFGYALGVIAMARSRDAFGHARLAVLAIIPIANLWLMAAPSKSPESNHSVPTFGMLSGAKGVLVGFFAFAAYVALMGFIREETSRAMAAAESDPAIVQAGMASALRAEGLESTLMQIADESPSLRIDEITMLRGVEAAGTTLRYLYEVSIDADALPNGMRAELIEQNCTNQGLRPLVEAGAAIEHVFLRLDGSEIGTVAITRNICGY